MVTVDVAAVEVRPLNILLLAVRDRYDEPVLKQLFRTTPLPLF